MVWKFGRVPGKLLLYTGRSQLRCHLIRTYPKHLPLELYQAQPAGFTVNQRLLGRLISLGYDWRSSWRTWKKGSLGFFAIRTAATTKLQLMALAKGYIVKCSNMVKNTSKEVLKKSEMKGFIWLSFHQYLWWFQAFPSWMFLVAKKQSSIAFQWMQTAVFELCWRQVSLTQWQNSQYNCGWLDEVSFNHH